MPSHTFAIAPGFKVRIDLGIGASLATILIFAILYIWQDESHGLPLYLHTLALLISSIFLALVGYGLHLRRQLPFSAVTIDDDGIWPAHRNKGEALIPWPAIAGIREHQLLQHLILMDEHGASLLRVEYQLTDFEQLREHILAKTRLAQAPQLPARFANAPSYHFVYFALLAGFAWLGWYVGQSDPLLGYGGMALVIAFIGHEYFTTPWRLRLDYESWTVDYPFASRRFGYFQIH